MGRGGRGRGGRRIWLCRYDHTCERCMSWIIPNLEVEKEGRGYLRERERHEEKIKNRNQQSTFTPSFFTSFYTKSNKIVINKQNIRFSLCSNILDLRIVPFAEREWCFGPAISYRRTRRKTESSQQNGGFSEFLGQRSGFNSKPIDFVKSTVLLGRVRRYSS